MRKLLPLVGYLILSVAATWPLAAHFDGWVPGLGDWGQNMWALWWTRHALLVEGQAPFFTDYLFYPEGVTLLFHPLDVADALLVLPLYGWLGGDAAYNILILLSFVLGGYGTYLLTLELTGHRGASFIAGMIFALAPYHMLRIQLGHLNLSSVQWLPFFALFLLRYVRHNAPRDGLWAVFFLAWMGLHSWYYVVYGGLFALAVIFWPPRPWRVIHIAGVLSLAALVLSPLIGPMVSLLLTTPFVGEHEPLRHSVDLYSFWIPGPPSTWADAFTAWWSPYAAANREPGASAYVGYTVLLLSLLALLNSRERWHKVWWLGIALGFTVLALGPQLQIGGQILDDVTLPYHWLSETVPMFDITGIPGRFVVMTALALAVLAGYGVAGWLSRRRVAVVVLVAVLVAVEYAAVPVYLSDTRLPDFYAQMGADAETYAIIDLRWDANFLLHAQTVHHKPLVGGWLARLPEEQAAYLNQGSLEHAFLYLLVGPESLQTTDTAALQAQIQTALAERNVRYIIDHDGQAGPWLTAFVGWQIVYTDEDITVYTGG